MSDRRNTTAEFIAELRKDYCGHGCNPSTCMCSLAEEAADLIEQLSAELKILHCLDVTSREGQRAFNEWRNRSVNQHDQ
jgi:hypothetical protein